MSVFSIEHGAVGSEFWCIPAALLLYLTISMLVGAAVRPWWEAHTVAHISL